MKMTPPPDMDQAPPPETRLAGPATGLIVTGILGLVLNVVCGLGAVVFTAQTKETRRPAGMDDETFKQYERGRDAAPLLQFCGCLCPAVIVYPLVLVGASRMRQARGYGMAIASAILAMLPCGVAFLLGLPIGIWALVVLMDPQVKAAFR